MEFFEILFRKKKLVEIIYDNDVETIQKRLHDDVSIANSKIVYHEQEDMHIPLLNIVVSANCFHEDSRILEVFLKHGANTNVYCKYMNESPLSIAIQKENVNIVKLLLEYGAIIHPFEFQQTAYNKTIDVAQILLLHGANLESKDEYGRTVFFIASRNENRIMMNFLLSQGSDINSSDEDKNTVLHKAVIDGYEKRYMLRFLIANGSKINAKNRFNKTPLDYCEDYLISHYLRMHGAKTCHEIEFENLIHEITNIHFDDLNKMDSLKLQENECVICIDDNAQERKIITPCNHVFHQSCIETWLQTIHDTCPYCRQFLHMDMILIRNSHLNGKVKNKMIKKMIKTNP